MSGRCVWAGGRTVTGDGGEVGVDGDGVVGVGALLLVVFQAGDPGAGQERQEGVWVPLGTGGAEDRCAEALDKKRPEDLAVRDDMNGPLAVEAAQPARGSGRDRGGRRRRRG